MGAGASAARRCNAGTTGNRSATRVPWPGWLWSAIVPPLWRTKP